MWTLIGTEWNKTKILIIEFNSQSFYSHTAVPPNLRCATHSERMHYWWYTGVVFNQAIDDALNNTFRQHKTYHVHIRSYESLFVWGLSYHSWILTYARYLWPLSSEGSLACYTYCNTGHPFIIGYLRGPVTLTPIAERLAMELSFITCFYNLGLPRLRFEHPLFRLRGERSNPLRHRRDSYEIRVKVY